MFFPVWIPWDSFFRPMRHITRVPTTHTILLHQRLGRMASCGPPPPRAAATPAAAAATAAARAAATPSAAAIHRVTLLQHPLSSKYNASTSSDILAAASQATAAAVLIPGSTSTHMKRRCNFRSEDVPCLGLLHEVAPAVPSAGRTRQERHAACVAKTARRVVCISTTLPGFAPTSA